MASWILDPTGWRPASLVHVMKPRRVLTLLTRLARRLAFHLFSDPEP